MLLRMTICLDFDRRRAYSVRNDVTNGDRKERFMKKVEKGHFVKVNYTGKLDNGDVFDTNVNTQPLEVEMGAGGIIKGFEDALLGMAEQEKKTFKLSPNEAYGERDDKLEQSFMRSALPDNFDPKLGEVVALQTPQGQPFPAKVKHTDDEKITFDLNHPLAGQSLTFEIEIMEINNESTAPACEPSSCGSCCSSCS
jgi:peptidylprolyl isomerase